MDSTDRIVTVHLLPSKVARLEKAAEELEELAQVQVRLYSC